MKEEKKFTTWYHGGIKENGNYISLSEENKRK